MSLLESLRVALEALSANKLRSTLTMLGIIIGVGSVIAIFALGRGTKLAISGELESIGSGQFILMPGRPGIDQATQRTELFTERDMTNIETLLPEVESVLTQQNLQAPVRYERQTVTANVSGTYSHYLELSGDKVASGRWFSKAEQEAGARVIVLGKGAVKRLFGENVNPIGKEVSVAGYPFAVIGVKELPSGLLGTLASSFGEQDNTYYVPITWVRRVTGNNAIFQILVKAKPGENPKAVMDDAIALVQRNHKGAQFSGQTFDQQLSALNTVMNVITGVLSAVAGISLVVGGVGIMNIMLVSVTERTREIGIRKAIGASYQNILIQFLIESVLLSLLGGGIGVGLAALPLFFVGRWLKISLLLDWVSISLALGFSAGVGMIFGVYPAAKAARLDPIEALRYE